MNMAKRRSKRSSNLPNRFKETAEASSPPEEEGIDEEQPAPAHAPELYEYSQDLISYDGGGQPPEVSREVNIAANDEVCENGDEEVVIRRTKKFGRSHKITFAEHNDRVAVFGQRIEVLMAEVRFLFYDEF